MDRRVVATEDSPDIFKQSDVGMMREKAAVYGETMSETTSDEAHKASSTAEALFSDLKKKVTDLFSEAEVELREIDKEEMALCQFLRQEIQQQQERGRQLRAEIQKAEFLIQQFMHGLPQGPFLEE